MTASDTITVLAEMFPDAFAPPDQPRRPLKIGIHAELRVAAPAISNTRLKEALFYYTNGKQYLRASTEDAVRIGLDGKPAGEVTAEEAASAKRRLQAAVVKEWERAWAKRRTKPTVSQQTPAAPPAALPVIPELDPAVRRDGLRDLREAAQGRRAESIHQ